MPAASEPAPFSDSAKAGMHSPLATFGRIEAFNASDPARLMAPLPSPCIAKAKSASQWR
ncbi:hypothetical protein D9M69_626990 [compost metagenome]